MKIIYSVKGDGLQTVVQGAVAALAGWPPVPVVGTDQMHQPHARGAIALVARRVSALFARPRIAKKCGPESPPKTGVAVIPVLRVDGVRRKI